jgi:hypothetical protein
MIYIEACGTDAGRITNGVALGALIALLMFIAYQLREVHDAYWIKGELKWLTLSLLIIPPAFIWTFFPQSPGGTDIYDGISNDL